MSKVQILLSTYNGEKYLKNLIESLLNQDYPNIEILIRDDGSTDATRDILEEFSTDKNIKIITGHNLGCINSFFSLLELSDETANYLAFCDQDDIWEKDKISRAVKFLDNIKGKPALYCSSLKLVDENLNFLSLTKSPQKISLENAIVENIVTGCTAVINKEAKDKILLGSPKKVLMHDWWIYMVVSSFGEVIFDKTSSILYRQHSSNVVGLPHNFILKYIDKFKRYFKRKEEKSILKQAEEFFNIYSKELSNDKRNTLDKFIHRKRNFLNRLFYAFNTKLYRQGKLDNLILKFLIIFDKI